MPTTTKYALRYPASSQAPNVPADMQNLAQDVEGALGKRGGWRNWLRNPHMQVQQRGAVAFTASGVYTADGWMKAHVGGTHSVTPTKLAVGASGRDSYLASAVASQALAGDYAQLVQRVESVRSLAGQQVTVSFTASAAAATSIAVETRQFFGTGGTPSADVTTAVAAFNISTTEARYSTTFTIPSIAGKTLGTTAGTDYLELIFWQSAGANFAARASNIGLQNTTVNLWDVQLEAGPDATVLEARSFATELHICQRYYVRYVDVAFPGMVQAATGGIVAVPAFPVPMRAAPTIAVSNFANFGVYNASTTTVALSSAIGLQGATPLGTRLNFAVTGGLTAGQATVLVALTGGQFIDFSAEL